MPQTTEKIVHVNGIDLCTETFGNPGDPALLLIMGAMASMDWWPELLCRRLAGQRRFVIRYDHRDTGRSTPYPLGAPGYDLDDLADDAVGILDAYGIESAHLVGMSLGGIIAQLIALKHPKRARSLTLIASQPLAPDDPSIPGIAPEILAFHARGAELDWANRDAVLDYQVDSWRLLSGSARPFDASLIRSMARRDGERTPDPRTAFNHALLEGGERWYGRLDEIRVPTLVIHGTDDPVLRFAYGQALARGISGARFMPLVGVGHELHPYDWDAIVAAVARLTS
ncbi:MAG: alpha/beta fold hydrolase [Myxococcaceae bacterium]